MKRPMHILTIIGARPQIIKAAAISRAVAGPFSGRITETILHTGQHYDANMSQVFFDELGIPQPQIQLGVGSGTHGQQVARMLEGIEASILNVKPDVVLLYGDTNSTLAGALAASKQHVPVAHVEAGLRSYNKAMPEEINRIVCDQCSTWLFCPTTTAVTNLQREGFDTSYSGRPSIDRPQVLLSGDVMFDNSMHFAERAAFRTGSVLQELGLQPDGFVLATIHRNGNTDDPKRLADILGSLLDARSAYGLPVVLPLHPRTRKCIELHPDSGLRHRIAASKDFHIIPPAGFLDMVDLERNARLVVTDSGGVQKEASFFGKPVVVLRNETEWVELVDLGQATLADADPARIRVAIDHFMHHPVPKIGSLYGEGDAAERICSALLN